MIKVLYRWRVAKEHFEEFTVAWASTTNQIHETISGAKGSLMLRSLEDEIEVITLAKWTSLQSWKAFWGNGKSIEMEAMRKIARCTSAEVFEEIGDYTVD